jgi:hypothetical protein
MGDHRDAGAGLVPAELGLVRVQLPLHLGSHGVEDGRGRGALRHERRHSPERGLLVGELSERFA